MEGEKEGIRRSVHKEVVAFQTDFLEDWRKKKIYKQNSAAQCDLLKTSAKYPFLNTLREQKNMRKVSSRPIIGFRNSESKFHVAFFLSVPSDFFVIDC